MKTKISALLLAVLIALTACSKEPVQEESGAQSESSESISQSEAEISEPSSDVSPEEAITEEVVFGTEGLDYGEPITDCNVIYGPEENRLFGHMNPTEISGEGIFFRTWVSFTEDETSGNLELFKLDEDGNIKTFGELSEYSEGGFEKEISDIVTLPTGKAYAFWLTGKCLEDSLGYSKTEYSYAEILKDGTFGEEKTFFAFEDETYINYIEKTNGGWCFVSGGEEIVVLDEELNVLSKTPTDRPDRAFLTNWNRYALVFQDKKGPTVQLFDPYNGILSPKYSFAEGFTDIYPGDTRFDLTLVSQSGDEISLCGVNIGEKPILLQKIKHPMLKDAGILSLGFDFEQRPTAILSYESEVRGGSSAVLVFGEESPVKTAAYSLTWENEAGEKLIVNIDLPENWTPEAVYKKGEDLKGWIDFYDEAGNKCGCILGVSETLKDGKTVKDIEFAEGFEPYFLKIGEKEYSLNILGLDGRSTRYATGYDYSFLEGSNVIRVLLYEAPHGVVRLSLHERMLDSIEVSFE